MSHVRPARPQDIVRMMEIARHSATAAHWDELEYTKLFAADSSRARVGLSLCEDEQVIGFLVARSVAPDDHEWEIENIAVVDAARRRGLGSRLLGEFLKLVHRRGASDVFLEVRESNQAARKLYEKWAFREAGRRKDYYRNPIEDALVFRFSFCHAGGILRVE